MIETENLKLIPCGPSHLAKAIKDKKGLEPLLGVSVPDGWPVFPGAMPRIYEKLRSDPSAAGWWSYLFVHAGDGVLAGDGGFKGPPDESNEVEIGYALVPGYRGRGLATEAARGLVGRAFSHPEVAAVRAETLRDGHGSIRVLEKLGMRFAGATDGVLRWRLDRQDFREGGAP
ncbi:MAG TPA: GNAT family N-acetyltransferase [Rubrobacter sp.]|nr:GNAT family N-acetyltransferase [Rubrobacter sp.]